MIWIYSNTQAASVWNFIPKPASEFFCVLVLISAPDFPGNPVPYSLFGPCGGLGLVRVIVVGIFVQFQLGLAVVHGSGSLRSNR